MPSDLPTPTPKRAAFQTRARVVELLGKEQIADGPTALSELLKNAIDAFASEATVSYSSKNRTLTVRDDGLGMRASDLLDRWLVVATESKRLPTDPSWLRFATESQRRKSKQYPPLGQKGIGRLAAAALGNGVLVWTRWGKGDAAERTLLFIHWGLFQHPLYSLDEIVIPYLSFPAGVPTVEDARELVSTVRTWLQSPAQEAKWRFEGDPEGSNDPDYQLGARELDRRLRALRREILEDLTAEIPAALNNDLKFEATPGTSFYIVSLTEHSEETFQFDLASPDGHSAAAEAPELEREVHAAFSPDAAPPSLRLLLGFSDPFGEVTARIRVRFEADGRDLSRLFNFWAERDFEQADHEIHLNVDWSGRATGTVRRYEQTLDYDFTPSKPLPRFHRPPGPLVIHVGYVAGRVDTHLERADYEAFEERLKAFGALYVYRDGIRVLPYGRPDQDFVGFEERRTRHIGRYFFSYRRMFGAVYIGSRSNEELRDKAGREGFVKNGAYRGLVKFLQEIFIDLALRYYGSEAAASYEQSVESAFEITPAADLLERRAAAELQQFLHSLENWERRLREAARDLEADYETASELVDQAERQQLPSPQLLRRIDTFLSRMRRDVTENLDCLGTEPPPVVLIPPADRPRFDRYLSERQRYETGAVARLSSIASNWEQLARTVLNGQRRERLAQRISEVEADCYKRIDDAYQQFLQACETLSADRAPQWRTKQFETLRGVLSTIGDDPLAVVLEDETGRMASQLETLLAQQLQQVREVFVPYWNIAISQLDALETAESGERAVGNLMRDLEKLQDRAQMLSELAQLGIIVESIDHDLRVLFRDLRGELDELLELVGHSIPARDVASKIRERFGSLDQLVTLLSPVFHDSDRRLETITGTEILSFVNRLFPPERRGELVIDSTKRFREMTLHKVYKPVVLASVANVIQNSIYWTGRTQNPRRVRFTVVPRGFVISDSGPGITARDRARVFEPFFSRRTDGRGLGLYIARMNLLENGMDISVADSPLTNALTGANFIIQKRSSDE